MAGRRIKHLSLSLGDRILFFHSHIFQTWSIFVFIMEKSLLLSLLFLIKGRASLVAQRLKHLPAMPETWVRSLGGEDPLEKEMATQSSIPAWRIPWTEEPGGLQSTGSQRVGHD